MLIPIERLLVRLRQVPRRADELLTLRARLREERRARPSDAERAAAVELCDLKVQLSGALSAVAACGTCATGKPAPRGTFVGGDCCAGVTADLFAEEEVAALAQAGTRPRDLRPPRTAHAGCAFRGDQGCTLDAAHRPERCVSYLCHLLKRELHAKGELAGIDDRIAAMRSVRIRFAELRARRLDDEILVPLEAAMRAGTPS